MIVSSIDTGDLHLCYVLSSPNKCLEGPIGLLANQTE